MDLLILIVVVVAIAAVAWIFFRPQLDTLLRRVGILPQPLTTTGTASILPASTNVGISKATVSRIGSVKGTAYQPAPVPVTMDISRSIDDVVPRTTLVRQLPARVV